MQQSTRDSLSTLFGVLPRVMLAVVVSLSWATPAFAIQSPPGCTGSGLGINLFSSLTRVNVGDSISYSIVVFNGTGSGPIVCDASGIQASIVTPDGVSHPITLVRTALSNGQSDFYPDAVTYIARSQDINPINGTLAATASDTGIIHQNVTDSAGGGNQGLNVFVLNTLHVIKTVVNTGGGTAVPADFSVHVQNLGVDELGSPAPGVGAPGTSYSLIAGTYTVSEVPNVLYTPTFSGDCNVSGSVSVVAGDNKTCTITNTFVPPATLHVIKVVNNTGGGTATAATFSVHVSTTTDVLGSPVPGVGTPGTSYTLRPGSYTVSETANALYTGVVSGDCAANGSISLLPGDNKTCTITNSFIPPLPATLHVIKLVVNASGGAATPAGFSVHVKSGGVDVGGSPAAGTAAPGALYTLAAGTYTVSEDANPLYVQTFLIGDCNASGSVTLLPGNDKICTIINTDIAPPPTPVVPPVVTGGGGSGGIVPFIGIQKVPTPLALPSGPGTVTYNYTVWNVGGQQALVDVHVTDDKCSPLTFLSGDSNGNGKLDVTERWLYSCTATLSQTTTNTSVATGFGDDTDHTPAIATAIATVAVGVAPGLPNTGVPPPLINIVKVPDRLTPFPFGGGAVTYTYTVTNPGVVSMHDVSVTDDKCVPVSMTSGDGNNNGLLDPGEVWMYTCRDTVPVSTINVATAVGRANGFTALGYAFATVLVGAPRLPDTGIAPYGPNESAWGAAIAASVLVLLGALLILRNRRRN